MKGKCTLGHFYTPSITILIAHHCIESQEFQERQIESSFTDAKTRQAILCKLQILLADVTCLQPFSSDSSTNSQQKQNLLQK